MYAHAPIKTSNCILSNNVDSPQEEICQILDK